MSRMAEFHPQTQFCVQVMHMVLIVLRYHVLYEPALQNASSPIFGSADKERTLGGTPGQEAPLLLAHKYSAVPKLCHTWDESVATYFFQTFSFGQSQDSEILWIQMGIFCKKKKKVQSTPKHFIISLIFTRKVQLQRLQEDRLHNLSQSFTSYHSFLADFSEYLLHTHQVLCQVVDVDGQRS